MIRNTYTNKDLRKVPKYQKFLILRTYNLLVVAILFAFIIADSIQKAKDNPIFGLTYFLAFSFVIYIIVAMHNKSFYGMFTPIKSYQEHMLVQLNNNKGRHGLLSIINSAFFAIIFYFTVSNNLMVAGGFAVITLLLQMMLVDTADLAKIYKVSKRFDVDITDYRLFDNELFESLTNEQIYYVHCVREEIVVFCSLAGKELSESEFKQKIDKEEYVLVTMLANQMERLGK